MILLNFNNMVLLLKIIKNYEKYKIFKMRTNRIYIFLNHKTVVLLLTNITQVVISLLTLMCRLKFYYVKDG